ncbi:hypothetical protein GLOTRDRAFT_133788 [Gloeophyllum trabeum ATCC 11539]|uniref:BTB domain-containing protein n=1 Tax=Gloeophyllum trabeum (strain ATCC 11539 / FP-39264 / Madison 617) TaxID=670483 RepID=S7R8N8_GLOTA|nr:uncharacterized protein GLOTRDRAFT_133788 [Gloeophyllum trabeum ATCC 11539]EPQ50685.1 hypothetical protein GLOTRDRAFT_133788 [Gloeophyllum trabeum ATCC 11539]
MDASSSNGDNAARKRPRTEANQNGGNTSHGETSQLRRHSELWYPDGNVVVVSKNIAFRIYGGLLARHSPIFKDMLSLNQPADAEKIAGCPIVRLADQPEDLESLFLALYERRFFKSTEATPMTTLLGILRLADKYCIDDLKEEARKELSSHFPKTSLAEWERTRPTRQKLLTDSPGIIIPVVMMALQLRLDVYHLALYECCQLPIADLFRGFTHSDGTVEQLSWEIMQVVMEQRERLQILSKAKVRVCKPKSPSCSKRALNYTHAGYFACVDSPSIPTLAARVDLHTEKLKNFPQLYDPLSLFAEVLAQMLQDNSLCQECKSALQAQHQAMKEDCWRLVRK